MFQSAQKIKRYVAGHDFDSFISDEKTMDAVVRNFEVIGEAANRVDPGFKTANPGIEWKRIRGFRNRIVHEYFGIDYTNYLFILVSLKCACVNSSSVFINYHL